MAENEALSGKQTAIVPADGRQWLRLPDESAQAYSALRAYLDGEPGKRSDSGGIPATIRAWTSDAKVRVPGYFGAWAARFRWKQRARRVGRVPGPVGDTVVNAEELAAARKEAVEVSERLMQLIRSEVRALEMVPGVSSMTAAERVRIQNLKADTLALLAAAMEAAAKTRIAALTGPG